MMEIEKVLELLSKEQTSKSDVEILGFTNKYNIYINSSLVKRKGRFTFIKGLVLNNWTIYQPNCCELTGCPCDKKSNTLELNEQEMKLYIKSEFIALIREIQLNLILEKSINE